MAINYQTGTLNPLSTTLAQDIRNAIVTGITAAIAAGKTNWAIVDNGYTNGTSIRTVFTNTAGFALLVHHSNTLTNTGLQFILGTDYNATTHTLNNIGYGNNGTASVAGTNGFSGVSLNPNSVATSAGAYPPHNTQYVFTAITGQSAWSLHIEDDYMYFSFKDGSTYLGQAMFAGRFNTLVSNSSLTDTYPYAMGVFRTNITGTVGAVLLNSLNNAGVNTKHSGQFFTFKMDSTPSLPGSYDKYSTNPAKAKLSYYYVARSASKPDTEASTYGWLRGYLPSSYHGYSDNAAWGDTTSIDGKAYMCLTNGTDIETASNVQMSLWVEI